MQTCSQINTNLTTNIEIRNLDTNELLCRTSNTLTNVGYSLLGDLFTSTSNINQITLSALNNTGVTQFQFSDAVQLDVINAYSTRSSNTGIVTINFETQADSSTISGLGTLNSIGLSVDDSLFSVASAGGISLGSSPISVLYQINLSLTQG